MLTFKLDYDKIIKLSYMIKDFQQKFNKERYRSGHNGTVLKTVVLKGTVGSNPTLSAKRQ